jgi:hypothetical protein
MHVNKDRSDKLGLSLIAVTKNTAELEILPILNEIALIN